MTCNLCMETMMWFKKAEKKNRAFQTKGMNRISQTRDLVDRSIIASQKGMYDNIGMEGWGQKVKRLE